MKIKRSFNYKVNLGGYETADFGCEIEKNGTRDDIPEIMRQCIATVSREVKNFRALDKEKLHNEKVRAIDVFEECMDDVNDFFEPIEEIGDTEKIVKPPEDPEDLEDDDSE